MLQGPEFIVAGGARNLLALLSHGRECGVDLLLMIVGLTLPVTLQAIYM